MVFLSAGTRWYLSMGPWYQHVPGRWSWMCQRGTGSGQGGRMQETRVRVAIIGAGFSGLGAAVRLHKAGITDFLVLERGADVGGTWRDNTYPGCRCDVPSHLYSFSFALNPHWSSTFSPQSEILDYLKDCAERYGVTPHVRFDTELESAGRSEERRVGKECRSRWSPYH